MGLIEWYGKHYKILFLVPMILLVISIGMIWHNVATTGDFVNKGVTLSGGVSATVTITDAITPNDIEDAIMQQFPQSDVQARSLNSFTTTQSYIVDVSGLGEDTETAANALEEFLESRYTVTAITTETTGPSLGDAFFMQTIMGVLLAFLWMGWVVYLYFGDKLSVKILVALIILTLTVMAVRGVLSGTTGLIILGVLVLASMVTYLIISVPSGAVILAAASTILFTLAVIDILGVRLSTAGVAAFLMLIGYSVDTDILLSTRVLKDPNKPLLERIKDSFKTGITMQLTTTAAVLIALIFSSSEVIRQIMLIILIGMVGDIIFTWLQNAGIIYWYEKRNKTAGTTQKRRARA